MKKGAQYPEKVRKRRSPETRKRIGEGVRRAWADPKVRQSWSGAIKDGLADPEVRQRKSEAAKRAFADPKVRQRRSEAAKRAFADPKVRQRRSEAMKRAWADPERRQARIEAINRAWADPKVRHSRIEAMKRTWADPERRQPRIETIQRSLTRPEVRARSAEAMKRTLRKPEVRQRMSEVMRRPEVLERIRRGVKASWTPEWRAAQSRWSKRMWQERLGAIKAANRLPSDWWKKPLIWRFIADTLLSSDEPLSNRKLGLALDATQLVRCPYGPTWAAALGLGSLSKGKSNAATVLIAKVRAWINKPGEGSRRTKP
jgi:hypothetical protein